MSKIKVNRIENTSTTDGGVSIDVDGHVTIDGQQLPTAGPLGNRNLIINGAMQVAQRGAGPFTNASGGYQTVDRFKLSGTMGGNFTLEQASDAPSGSGFNKSFKALAPTGFSSPTPTASAKIVTSIEGQNLQQLLKGSSSALPVTLSFWVKSVVTGTYIFELVDDDSNRSISTAYSVSASNTWEKKVITIAGDTSGVLDNDANSSFSLVWWIGAGSNFTSGTLSTSWASMVTANRAAGQVNAVASNNDAFYITGVQLEVGSKATPFEHRSYGDELARCQRYLQLVNYNTGGGYAVNHWVFRDSAHYILDFKHKVEMRDGPTLVAIGSNGLTGLDNTKFALYNLNTGSSVQVSGSTGNWSITQATTGRSTLRFTGTSLQGTTGNIAGCDTMLANTLIFATAEL